MKIKTENLEYRYPSFNFSSELALSNINLEIEDNEFIGLVGPTGSGKTTLVQHFNGLLKPTRGKILIDDSDLWSGKVNLVQIRQRIGLVFQFPEVQFFEGTIYDEIAFGPRNLDLPKSEVKWRVRNALEQMGIDIEPYKDRSPLRLSEGEKRKIAIASILAMDPEVLILDEPTAGIDYPGIINLEKIFKTIFHSGKTIILISHDIDMVARLVNRIIVLNAGKVILDGPKEEILAEEQSLRSVGLEIPKITRFLRQFVERGVNVRNDIYTIEQAKEELDRFFRKEEKIFT